MSKITRSKRNTPFVLINKESLQDKSISWQAKGLLAYLLSLPDNWQILVADLANRSKNGRDSTAAILKELIDAGYIERIRCKNEKNQFEGYSYTVFDTPQTEKPFTENSKTDFPNTGNPTLINNNISKETLTKKPKSEETPPHKTDITQKIQKSKPFWLVELEGSPIFQKFDKIVQDAFLEYCEYREQTLQTGDKPKTLAAATVRQNAKKAECFLKTYSSELVAESLNLATASGTNSDFNPIWVQERREKAKKEQEKNPTKHTKQRTNNIPLLEGDLMYLNTWLND